MQKICLCVSCMLLFGKAFSQESDVAQVSNCEPEMRQFIVVNTKRTSLKSAQECKRATNEIVDSIFAEETGKQPEQNVSEALFSVARMNILDEQGDGCGVAIWGFTRMETTLHSREVFTGRSRSV